MRIAIIGHHNELYPGFNALMTDNFALGFAELGCEVTVFLPETEQKSQIAILQEKNVDLDCLSRPHRSVAYELLTTSNSKMGTFDVGVWQTYSPEVLELYWEPFRKACKITTKNFPRIFSGEEQKDFGILAGRANMFDIIGMALRDDFNIASNLSEEYAELSDKLFLYTPRGFNPALFDGIPKPLHPHIIIEEGVNAQNDEFAMFKKVLPIVKNVFPETKVIGARINDEKIIDRNLPLLPAKRFYSEFLAQGWVYFMPDVNNTMQGKNLVIQQDGSKKYLGLYENQIIEVQMGGGLVVGESNALPKELIASNNIGHRYHEDASPNSIADFIIDGFKNFDSRSVEAKNWALSHHNIQSMVRPVFDLAKQII